MLNQTKKLSDVFTEQEKTFLKEKVKFTDCGGWLDGLYGNMNLKSLKDVNDPLYESSRIKMHKFNVSEVDLISKEIGAERRWD